MIELYEPRLEELWFKAAMLADAETMSYNHAYGGTIPFPREKWAGWYERWIANQDGSRFYRYIKDGDCFLGEVAYHLDEERQIYIADVIVHATHRGKGIGREALQLLCEAARPRGIKTIYDEIALDNPAVSMFVRCGFEEVMRNDELILVKKELSV